ncbi:hypothetical protein BC629DRAFT_1589255 [Irpex lacteus]|nr:hypothetical protein BC629DRAFT_1589255 [Irpex lacteus]
MFYIRNKPNPRRRNWRVRQLVFDRFFVVPRNAEGPKKAGGGFQTFALPAGQKIVVPVVFRGPPEDDVTAVPTHVPNLNILRDPYGLDGPITFSHTPVCPQLRHTPSSGSPLLLYPTHNHGRRFDKDLFNAEQYPVDFGESAQAETEAQSEAEPSPIMPIGTPLTEPPPIPIPNHDEIRVSSTFHGNANLEGALPDTMILSADADEPAEVLNVVLHSLYGKSCDVYKPSFECISSSIPVFKKYGLTPLQRYISRDTPLYRTILGLAPLHPVDVFALAASEKLDELAPVVDKIGTTYIQRLYHLHGTRKDQLRALLDLRITPHDDTTRCSVENRQLLNRTYDLVAKQIFYTASPAITRVGIEVPMQGLVNSLTCPDCKSSVQRHIEEVCTRWSQFERTI